MFSGSGKGLKLLEWYLLAGLLVFWIVTLLLRAEFISFVLGLLVFWGFFAALRLRWGPLWSLGMEWQRWGRVSNGWQQPPKQRDWSKVPARTFDLQFSLLIVATALLIAGFIITRWEDTNKASWLSLLLPLDVFAWLTIKWLGSLEDTLEPKARENMDFIPYPRKKSASGEEEWRTEQRREMRPGRKR